MLDCYEVVMLIGAEVWDAFNHTSTHLRLNFQVTPSYIELITQLGDLRYETATVDGSFVFLVLLDVAMPGIPVQQFCPTFLHEVGKNPLGNKNHP